MDSPRNWPLRPLVLLVVLAGLALTVVTAITSVQHAKDTRADWLGEQAELVGIETKEAVRRSVDALTAISVFMETVPASGQDDYVAFASGLDPSFSQIGIGYLAVVPGIELDSYTAAMRSELPGFRVNQLSAQGEVMPVSRDRQTYYPVQYFLPGNILREATAGEAESPLALSVGIDGGSQAEWRPGLDEAVATASPTVSGFVEIAFNETFVGKAFIVAVPVRSDSGEVIGLVAAPMVDFLLPTELDVSTADDITWSIGSDSSDSAGEDGIVTSIEVPGTTWSIAVAPTAGAEAKLAGQPAWLITLMGLAITAATGLLAQLLTTRRGSQQRLAEMDRISTAKDRFLASVSHEIRTPLTIVMGVANELRDRSHDFDFAETRELLELMVEQSDEVSAIVDDLLVAARADYDGIQVNRNRVCLYEQAQHLMESGGVEARLVGGETPALADAARVRQILRNLLSNAARYGGPNIEVRVGSNEEWATLSVVDDGPPISDNERGNIFEAYTTSTDFDPSLGSVGIGLGLFVSNQLANTLGGHLAYEHDGRNSIFCLSLPAPEPPPTHIADTGLSQLDGVVPVADRELVHRSEETSF